MHCSGSFYRLSLLVALLSVISPAMADGEDTPRTVLIGFAGALSGVSENFGKSLANAAELAIAEANRTPLRIDGKRILLRLVRMDDQSDPARARQVANALVKTGVVGVVGGVNSATTIAASSVYAQAGIPQISPSSTVRKFTEQGYRTAFRTVGIDDDATAYLAEYSVRELHVGRIALVDNGTVFGVSVATRYGELAKEYGATVVSRDSINDLATDFNDLLGRIKAADVDAIFLGSYSAQTSMFAQSMQRLNIKARLITSMIGIVGPAFFISAGTAANGSLSQEAGVPFAKMPGWKKFETDFTQRFDFNIYGMTAFSYDAAQVLIAAIRHANSVEPDKIIGALHRISYKGLTGTIAFDAKGDLRNPSFTIYEAQNQKWVPVRSDSGR